MSVPSVVKGQYFDVAVDPDGSGTFVVICGLTTRNLTHQVNTTDDSIRDCDDPTMVPWRVLNANSQQKDMAGTGLHNRAQTNLIRQILGKTLTYRFIEGEPGDDLVSQGYWEGPFMLTNWQEGASDGANVTSQFTFASDGEVPWVSTMAPTLATLTVSPLTATANSAWTGTITGKTAGSTITASASGATGVSVTGNQVTATWATAGSKTVTLTETFAEASNSPKVTTITVVVS